MEKLRPPGEILEERLRERGISQQDFAAMIGKTTQQVNDVLKDRRPFTDDLPIALEALNLGSAESWADLVSRYRLSRLREDSSVADQVLKRKRLQDLQYRAAVKRGWFAPADDVDAQVEQVRQLLRVRSFDESPAVKPLYRAKITTEATNLWIAQVIRIAQTQKCDHFDSTALHQMVAELKPLCEKAEDVVKVGDVLARYGIRFVVLPQLPTMRVDGALLWDEGRPIIALSLRYDRIDWFWFTLLHEVAHVVAGHTHDVVDVVDDEGPDKFEREADRLATSWLLSEREYQAFVGRQNGRFSAQSVRLFAGLIANIHPGILTGRLQRDGFIPWSNLRGFLEPVRPHLGRWISE